MQIVRELAGYTMGQADIIRRAMSKKKQHVIDEERQNFVYGNSERGIKGCISNGISENTANKIYDKMVDFAKYAFNKSHAAAYAAITLQTAWLKFYYPIEYMAALFTSVSDNPSKLAGYIQTAKNEGISILSPDINKSGSEFEVSNNAILFSLSGIQGISYAQSKLIEEERKKNGQYYNYEDVLNRLSDIGCKKTAFVNLAKAGAFDHLGKIYRKQYVVVTEEALHNISSKKKNNVQGQLSLFDYCQSNEEMRSNLEIQFPDIPEYDIETLLECEKEVTGVYISGHPLDKYSGFYEKYVTNNAAEFIREEESGALGVADDQPVSCGGLLKNVRIAYTKKDNRAMAFFTLEDLYGEISCILFPAKYDKYKQYLHQGNKILVTGRASVEDEKNASLAVEDIKSFSEVPQNIWIQFPDLQTYKQDTKKIDSLIKKDSPDNLIIYIRKEHQKKIYREAVDQETYKEILEQYGEENVKITF